MEYRKIKCDRCLRKRDLFQYTNLEEDKWVLQRKDNGNVVHPRFTEERVNLAQSRGLCEECAVEINKREYDSKLSTNLGEK